MSLPKGSREGPLIGLLIDLVVGTISQWFGEKAAKDEPWWVQLLAALGCSLLLLFVLFAIYVVIQALA